MAGEVITSPAPLVGYHPPLGKAEMPPDYDYAGKILNSFAKSAAIANQRRALEQELKQISLQDKRLTYQMSHDEKQMNLDERRLKQEDRQMTLMDEYHDAVIKNQEFSNDTERQRVTRVKEGSEAAGLLLRRLSQNPETVGTQAGRVWSDGAINEFWPYMDNTSVRAIVDDERSRQERATSNLEQAQKVSAENYHGTIRSLNSGSQYSWRTEDFDMDDEFWGNENNTRVIRHDRRTGDYITPAAYWKLPQKEREATDENGKPYFKARPLSIKSYEQTRAARNQFKQMTNPDPGTSPYKPSGGISTGGAKSKREQAIEILKKNGKRTTEADIQHVMNQL